MIKWLSVFYLKNWLPTRKESTAVSLRNDMQQLTQFTVYLVIYHKPFALKNRQFLPSKPDRSGKKRFVIILFKKSIYLI